MMKRLLRAFLFSLFISCFCILPFHVFPSYAQENEEWLVESRADEIYEEAEDKMQALYDDAMKRAREADIESVSPKDPIKFFIRWVYKIYLAIRSSAVYVGAISILFGSAVAWMVRYNKHLFRKMILTFVIGVPVLLLCVCFGVGALIG